MNKFLICLGIACGFSQPVLAWNAEGHMVVAQMAYNHLGPIAKAKCDALVAVPVVYSSSTTSNFVTASVWADDNKSGLGSSIWHYIDLPFSLDGTSTNSFVPASFDVVQAINLSISTLQNSSATQSNQAVSLRYLLHFVGDIQQPLHTSDAFFASQPNGDGGGNGFSIKGTWNNLHSLWDSGGGYLTDSLSRPLSAASQTTLNNKVAAIETDYPYTPNPGTIPDPMVWAREGQGVAETVSYVGITLSSTPTTAYLNTAEATTEQRMALGGHRLADLLNTLYPSRTAPTVTWTNPAAIAYGVALGSTQLNATVSAPGTFSYSPQANAVLNAGTNILSVVFTPSDTNSYTMATNHVSLVVTQAVPVVTWPAPAATTYGTALSSAQLNATANVPGSLAYTPSAGAVLPAGSALLTVFFTPTDTLDYTTATGSVNLTVLPAGLTVTASNASRAYGQDNPSFGGTITGLRNGDNITASYTTTATSASPAGTYPITPAPVDPNGSLANYLVTTNNGTLTIGLPPEITTQPTNQLVWSGGTAQFEVAADGTDPLAYQWWFNQTNLLAGATNAVLVLTNVGLSQEGFYSAAVMNIYGTAASTNAQLAVCAAPSICGFDDYLSGTNGSTGSRTLTLTATVNPHNLPAMAWFEYGLTPSYSGSGGLTSLPAGDAGVDISTSVDSIVPGITYHCHVVASNSLGLVATPDQPIYVPSLSVPGDLNGDGVVDQNELDAVLANYWPNSPWLAMTNTAGLSSTNVRFALTNASNWNFSVLVSTNLVDWSYLGPATPLYQFNDPLATNAPRRFYRLSWP